ncbi:indole-3-glycerol phosphate synthase TrpC [Chloroflexota bacterium]
MTFLERIVAANAPALEERKAQHPVEEMENAARSCPPARSLALALQGEDVSVIAEVKKASPSKGVFRRRFNAVELARTYAAYGAAAISVLTEPRFFHGSLTTLRRVVRALGDSRPPVLRKDFIVDPYQVFEARACGADCILLIVALLDDGRLKSLLGLSHELGMDCLVEVHDEAELERALRTDTRVIGVNNRDLHTFEVDLATFERLRPQIPDGRVVVAESGIHDAKDVRRLRESGVDAVLVGEALVMASHTGMKLRELKCIA